MIQASTPPEYSNNLANLRTESALNKTERDESLTSNRARLLMSDLNTESF